MKKTINNGVILLIVLLGVTSYGQFGVKAGAGVSSWSLKDRDVNAGKELFDSGFAFHAGFGFEIGFGDMVSVEPALMFSQKGFGADLGEFFKIKTNFVEMPINVKIYIVELGNTASLYALAGGYVSYMFSAKANGEKRDIGNKDGDLFKTLDGGINVGVGAKLFDSLNADITGGIGIANLANDQSNGTASKINVVRLTVTYQFGG